MVTQKKEMLNPQKLRLIAKDGEDFQVLSSLFQFAVFPAFQLRYDAAENTGPLILLADRFCWEDKAEMLKGETIYTRALSSLSFYNVQKLQYQNFDPKDVEQVHVFLAMELKGEGEVIITLAGGGRLKLQIGALDCRLTDLEERTYTTTLPDYNDIDTIQAVA